MNYAFDKNQWRKNAFELIKKDLNFASGFNIAGNYNNAKENHLVVVYGITQVGKTSLILNLIGLQEKFFQTVYETLRANQPVGNSSTSTAILYSISDSDKYKLSIHKFNSSIAEKYEEYDSDGMIKRLKEIRNDVEKHRFDVSNVVSISIPYNFFDSNARNSNISIIDLPGDCDKNREAMVHVSNLLTRYIPIASTCIIAARSGFIQNLETLTLPNNVSWKEMSHRFIIVITRAYSDANMKSFFKNNKVYTNEDYYNYVQKSYEKEIKNVLGSGNKLEVYPLEIGGSLTGLYADAGLKPSDKEAISYAKHKTLERLSQSILSKEGDRLQAAISDLRAIVNYRCNVEINSVKKDIDNKNCLIQSNKKRISECIKLIEGLKECRDNYKSTAEKIENDISGLKNNAFTENVKDWWDNIVSKYSGEKLYSFNSDKKISKTKKEAAFNIMYDYVSDRITQYLQMECMGLLKENLLEDIIEEHRRDKGIKTFKINDGIFSHHVTNDDIFDCLHDLWNEIKIAFSQRLSQKINTLNVELRKANEACSLWQNRIQQLNAEISECNNAISQCNDEIKELNDMLEANEKLKNEDFEVLERYLSYAKTAYEDARNELMSMINSNETTPEEKSALILYIGILDKDYMKIAGGEQP